MACSQKESSTGGELSKVAWSQTCVENRCLDNILIVIGYCSPTRPSEMSHREQVQGKQVLARV